MDDLDELKAMLAKASTLPWRHDKIDPLDKSIPIRGKDDRNEGDVCGGTAVAYVDNDDVDPKESRANVRLIIAAVNSLPSLLSRVERAESALRWVLDIGDITTRYVGVDEGGTTLVNDSLLVEFQRAQEKARAALAQGGEE